VSGVAKGSVEPSSLAGTATTFPRLLLSSMAGNFATPVPAAYSAVGGKRLSTRLVDGFGCVASEETGVKRVAPRQPPTPTLPPLRGGREMR
jgi:hypothetical protein